MPKLCYDLRDGKVINDFQSRATDEGLKRNAVKRFKLDGDLTVTEDDFEIREVARVEYDTAKEDYTGPFAISEDQERLRLKNARASAGIKLKGLGFTEVELRVLLQAENN